MLLSCNKSSVQSEETKSTSEIHAIDGNQASEIRDNIDDSANILATREWDLPTDLQGEWKQANEISYSDTIRFDNVRAAVIINFTVLSKDASNFIMKSATVNAFERDKSYNLTASISDQINMGSKTAFDTYITVNLQATLKPGRRSSRKLEGKMLAVYAKKGFVEPL
ncbi:hypothetical protein DC20_00375 [Rufibacter tibetensis]|uniref:Uncharacterized protein n=2 Tax=Rufibacter tibetensis TaxID=512763 RepID=A0A0N7HVY3_9BACT|nr:hypothetical protein DC20_00375 [Rufibacter tibetensis]